MVSGRERRHSQNEKPKSFLGSTSSQREQTDWTPSQMSLRRRISVLREDLLKSHSGLQTFGDHSRTHHPNNLAPASAPTAELFRFPEC